MDPFAQIKVYESVADFFKSNPDRLYRFWVYKHIFTPDEIEKKYIDQTPYEESRCRMGVIREVIGSLPVQSQPNGSRSSLPGENGAIAVH